MIFKLSPQNGHYTPLLCFHLGRRLEFLFYCSTIVQLWDGKKAYVLGFRYSSSNEPFLLHISSMGIRTSHTCILRLSWEQSDYYGQKSGYQRQVCTHIDLTENRIDKVERILKGSLDLIPSPSPSVKIQLIGRKVCLRCKGKTLLAGLLTSRSNVLPCYLK